MLKGAAVIRGQPAGWRCIALPIIREIRHPPAVPAISITENPQQYGVALALAAFVTLAGWFIQNLIGYWSIALLYLLIVMIAGTQLSRGPTLFLAALSALLWNYLFIPPTLTFHIRAPHDVMMFLKIGRAHV